MPDSQQTGSSKRARQRQAWLRRLYFLGLTLLFFYIIYIGISHIFRYNKFKQRHAQLSQNILQKQRERRQLKAELLDMDTASYWEYKARRELNFIKDGERVYQLDTRAPVQERLK